MTKITLQDGKIVMRDGKVGTEQGCCCGGPCDCVIKTWWYYSEFDTYGDLNQSYLDSADRIMNKWKQNIESAGWTVTFFGANGESLLYQNGQLPSGVDPSDSYVWREIHAECCATNRRWALPECAPYQYTDISDMTGVDGLWTDNNGIERPGIGTPGFLAISATSENQCWPFDVAHPGTYQQTFFTDAWPTCFTSCRVVISASRYACDANAGPFNDEGDAEAEVECQSIREDWLPAIRTAFENAGWQWWSYSIPYNEAATATHPDLPESCGVMAPTITEYDCGPSPAGPYPCDIYISATCNICDPESAETEALTGDAAGTTITLTYLDGPKIGQTYEFPADTIPVCNPLP